MTFDEWTKKLEKHDITKLFNKYTFIEVIEDLKKEYAPEIKMTFEEHEYFKTFRYTDSSFTQLSESIMKQGDLVKFGLKSTPLYLMGLSEEQLMQAWLNPEKIKVIGEDENE